MYAGWTHGDDVWIPVPTLLERRDYLYLHLEFWGQHIVDIEAFDSPYFVLMARVRASTMTGDYQSLLPFEPVLYEEEPLECLNKGRECLEFRKTAKDCKVARSNTTDLIFRSWKCRHDQSRLFLLTFTVVQVGAVR
jgi:hypothetical protein